MGWVRLDDAFYDHPGHATLSLSAWGLWAWSLAWSNRNLRDGKIPLPVVERMDPAGDATAELVGAGRWDRDEQTVIVHDYLEYQPSADEVRKKRERERTRWQRRGKRHESDLPADSDPEPEPPPPQHRAESPRTPPASQPQEKHAPTERAPTRRGLMFSKITDVLRIDPDMLTRSERSDVSKTAKELDEAGIDPDALDGFPAWWAKAFPNTTLTHRCLRQHWAKFASNGGAPSRPKCKQHPDRGCLWLGDGAGWAHSDEVRV